MILTLDFTQLPEWFYALAKILFFMYLFKYGVLGLARITVAVVASFAAINDLNLSRENQRNESSRPPYDDEKSN